MLNREFWSERLTKLALDASSEGDTLVEQAALFLINTLDCGDWQRKTLAHIFRDLTEIVRLTTR
jgi:hypothetical protein